MTLITIKVEHQVPQGPHCYYSGDFFGKDMCHYYKRRNRTGKGGKIERNLPRCALFEEWLVKYQKCEKCRTLSEGTE